MPNLAQISAAEGRRRPAFHAETSKCCSHATERDASSPSTGVVKRALAVPNAYGSTKYERGRNRRRLS